VLRIYTKIELITFVKNLKNKVKLNRRIKLIWDFKGEESFKIAEHHCVHLKEFAQIDKLKFHEINSNKISDNHSEAYIVVNEADMIIFRDALKPHRGEVAK